MRKKEVLVDILVLYLCILQVESRRSCFKRRKVPEVKQCVEPDFLLDDEWIHSVSRQANSIVNREAFENVFTSSLNNTIRDGQQENFLTSTTHRCKNDRRGKSKRRKGKQLPGPLPKNLIENSLCEWKTVENVDVNRKPTKIIENKCQCRYTKTLKRNYMCENLEMYMSVLRRVGCVEGVFRYTRVWEPYAVACVAVRLPKPKQINGEMIASNI